MFEICLSILLLRWQEIKQKGGVAAVAGSFNKIKAEAERLEVMDKAGGILAELLYSEKLLSQIKEYRPIMVPVSVPVYGSVDCVVEVTDAHLLLLFSSFTITGRPKGIYYLHLSSWWASVTQKNSCPRCH